VKLIIMPLPQVTRLFLDKHVNQALHHRQYRLGYLRELYWQDLSRGTQLIETQGHRLGQINALSVIHYADVEFGYLQD
jgi:predicted ATP-dependent protease